MKPDTFKVPVNGAAWIKTMAPDVDYKEAYATVRDAVMVSLDGYTGPPLTTSQLVERLWPTAGETKVPSFQRQRVYKALAAMAIRDLAAYCERGPERVRGKYTPRKLGEPQIVRPWLWRAKGEPHFEAVMPACCPHCGGELPRGIRT